MIKSQGQGCEVIAQKLLPRLSYSGQVDGWIDRQTDSLISIYSTLQTSFAGF